MSWSAVSIRLHSKSLSPEMLAEIVGLTPEQRFTRDPAQERDENTAVFGSGADSGSSLEDKLDWATSILESLGDAHRFGYEVDVILAAARSSELREFVVRPSLLRALVAANAELNVFLEEDVDD